MTRIAERRLTRRRAAELAPHADMRGGTLRQPRPTRQADRAPAAWRTPVV